MRLARKHRTEGSRRRPPITQPSEDRRYACEIPPQKKRARKTKPHRSMDQDRVSGNTSVIPISCGSQRLCCPEPTRTERCENETARFGGRSRERESQGFSGTRRG